MNRYVNGYQPKSLTDLAGKVADAKDRDIPKLLLQLRNLIDGCGDNGKALVQLKHDAWEYDLLHVLSICIKKDFSQVDGQWETAAKLITILSECCVGLDPGKDVEEFRKEFLPSVFARSLVVASNTESRYTKMSQVLEDRKKTIFQAFQDMMDSLILLISGYRFLATQLLQSNVFMQLLLTDNEETVFVVLATIQRANRMNEHVLKSLKPKTVKALLDEITYKLSSTTSEKIASAACRTLVVICDAHPPTVTVLCDRYKGLGPLLNKWLNHGFDRDLRVLIGLLNDVGEQHAAGEKYVRAASVIQAWWKSLYTRQKLKRANTAFGKFQRSFRSRKELEQKDKEEGQLKTELEHQKLLNRKRAMRKFHQKRLQTIEFLAPDEVDKHLAKEQQHAAIKIQKTFRGYMACKMTDKNRRIRLRNKAAVRIQRAVRKWQKKKRAQRQEPPNWQRPPGLTDTRRVELQERITSWRDDHTVHAQTDEERAALHDKVQSLLKREAMVSRVTRKCHRRRETLLAQLAVDSKLIMDGPILEDVTQERVESYKSYSVPVMARARFNHTQELRLLQQPWWRRLGDEYQDAKIEEELNWKVF